MVLSLHIHFQIGILLCSLSGFSGAAIFFFFQQSQAAAKQPAKRQKKFKNCKKTSGEMWSGCVAARRDLRASAAFHKDALVWSERLLIKIQQGVFSTLAKLLCCCCFFSASAEHFQRFSVIRSTSTEWHSACHESAHERWDLWSPTLNGI